MENAFRHKVNIPTRGHSSHLTKGIFGKQKFTQLNKISLPHFKKTPLLKITSRFRDKTVTLKTLYRTYNIKQRGFEVSHKLVFVSDIENSEAWQTNRRASGLRQTRSLGRI